MKPVDGRRQPPKAGDPGRAKKPFRIYKLEERIAPKKGGNTKNCGTANCASDSIGASGY